MKVGCVVLTTGERPTELAHALGSVREQRDVDVESVVVLNTDRTDVADTLDLHGARLVAPGTNLGIPAGRNLGAAQLDDAPIVLFLDDDAALVDADSLARVVAWFADDPTVGAVTMRIVDPETGRTQRRHVPRLRVGDPLRSSWVTTFLGGATAVRLAAFHQVGGLPDEFFYAHEETSLAWRLLDRGYRIRYDASLVVQHPATPPARHDVYHRLSARNRVLLARKHLPAAVATLYLATWSVLSLARSRGGRLATLRGFVEGFRVRGVERNPIRWATVGRMARYGRPPIV